MMEHFYVMFGDPSCSGFIYRAEKQTDAQTPLKTLHSDYRRCG